MFKIGGANTPACRFCWDSTETSSHLLRQCRNLQHIREGIANAQDRKNRNFSWKRGRSGPLFSIKKMDLKFADFILEMEKEWNIFNDLI